MSDNPTTPPTKPRIVVAVDRSQSAIQAAVLAHGVFGDDVEYTVISVAKGDAAALRDSESELPTTIPFDMAAATDRGIAQETASAVASKTLGGQARAAGLVSSNPAKLICQICTDMNAHFLVIGSPSRSVWKRIFTRSVGGYIVRNAPCPVLVSQSVD
jgi:nucleotide-binding universal stress UspA family protein